MVQKNTINKLIIIVGPTCSGKSGLSIDVAKRFNGSIVSADSMQIYKGLDIGTAKISSNEMNDIKHYMIDILQPNQEFSVTQYRDMANNSIEDIIAQGLRPIVTGGTGLYIDSLIYSMTYGSVEKNEQLRNELSQEIEEFGAIHLHKKLMQLDPLSASKIHPNNTKRLIRAMEVATLGKKQEQASPQIIRDHIIIGLDVGRELLYSRINDRVEIMFQQGIVDEVTSLKDLYCMESQSMQAIGYKEFNHYFNGDMNLDEVKELIKKNTRNYAKRQMTWFRRYHNIVWINPLTEPEIAYDCIKRNI